MWKTENGTSRLDLSRVDQKEFKVTSDPERDLHLVCPRKGKWSWDAEEKWLRSVVVDGSGRIRSCSFPKFGNYGEFPDDTDRLNRALAGNERVLFSHKEDGSLCVRSVVDGEVILRTRGTLYGGEDMDDGTPSFGSRFRKTAEEKYPILLDPAWMPEGATLLFEYVAPDNRVVVGYKEPDLVFLGGVSHHPSPKLLTWDFLQALAKEYSLNLVRVHELPADPELMMKKVRDWRTEGIVARCAAGQVLVKVKSAYYLANHRMKFSMTYKVITEFVRTAQVLDEDDLVDKLRSYDYDWEVVEGAKELYGRYIAAKTQADEWKDKAAKLAAPLMAGKDLKDPDCRKEFAMVACKQAPALKTMMFLIYDGRLARLRQFHQKLVDNECRSTSK